MRVLIIFAFVGAALCHEATILTNAPLAYSTAYVESKPSYEYSTSVKTADYSNYASVRSGGELTAVPAVAAIQPQLVQYVEQPQLLRYAEQPIIAHAAPQLLRTVATIQPQQQLFVAAPQRETIIAEQAPAVVALKTSHPETVIAAAPAIAAPLPYFHRNLAHPIVSPVILPKVQVSSAPAAAAAVVETYAPAIPARHAHIAAVPAITPVVEHVVEQQVVGHAVVGEGILADKTQYHSQNELGEATYGHSEPLQTHNAIQDAAGNKAGQFSYVAPDGRVLTTEYIADENGYRAASNAFPIDPNHATVHSRRRRALVPVVGPAHLSTAYSSTYRVDAPQYRAIHSTPYYNNLISLAPHAAYSPYYSSPLLARSSIVPTYAIHH